MDTYQLRRQIIDMINGCSRMNPDEVWLFVNAEFRVLASELDMPRIPDSWDAELDNVLNFLYGESYER